MHEEHYANHTAQLEMEQATLTTKYDQLAEKYEQKRLALLVAEAKLQFDLGSAELQIAEMRKELATMQYRLNMGEEKVHLILSRHKDKMRKMVAETLDNGWRTWSAQAAKLQLLRADPGNRKKQGQDFFKIDDAAIRFKKSWPMTYTIF